MLIVGFRLFTMSLYTTCVWTFWRISCFLDGSCFNFPACVRLMWKKIFNWVCKILLRFLMFFHWMLLFIPFGIFIELLYDLGTLPFSMLAKFCGGSNDGHWNPYTCKLIWGWRWLPSYSKLNLRRYWYFWVMGLFCLNGLNAK